MFVILGLIGLIINFWSEIIGKLLVSVILRKKVDVFEVVFVVRKRWLLIILVESFVLRFLMLVISKEFVVWLFFERVILFFLFMLYIFYLKCKVLGDCFLVKYFIRIKLLLFWVVVK